MIYKGHGLIDKYDIVIESGILDNLAKELESFQKVFFVVDKFFFSSFNERLSTLGNLYYIEANEENKTLDKANEIIKLLIKNNFNKDDVLVSLGGGVVSDLTGFVASIYKRGIKWINIPTTTLSMIDASIGGKTAVNFNGIKNCIGAIYFPNKVLIDPLILQTLNKRHFYNGLCEALKLALTLDITLLTLLKNPFNNINQIIEKCVAIKDNIVSQDVYDNDIRHVLNYGHTIGHALEMSYCDVYHGEAILQGMYYMAYKSVQTVILEYKKLFEIEFIDNVNFNTIINHIKQDKKCRKNVIDCVFVSECGKYSIQEMNIKMIKNLMEGK